MRTRCPLPPNAPHSTLTPLACTSSTVEHLYYSPKRNVSSRITIARWHPMNGCVSWKDSPCQGSNQGSNFRKNVFEAQHCVAFHILKLRLKVGARDSAWARSPSAAWRPGFKHLTRPSLYVIDSRKYLPGFQVCIAGCVCLQVEFSPFEDGKLAVATSQYFGIVGNGGLHFLSLDERGMREVR